MTRSLTCVLLGFSLCGCVHAVDLRAPRDVWRDVGIHQFGSAAFHVSQDSLTIIDPQCGRFILKNPRWQVAASRSYSYEVVQTLEVSDACHGAERARFAVVSAVLDEDSDPVRFPFGQRITYSLATCSIMEGPQCTDLITRYIDLELGETVRNLTDERERELGKTSATAHVR